MPDTPLALPSRATPPACDAPTPRPSPRLAHLRATPISAPGPACHAPSVPRPLAASPRCPASASVSLFPCPSPRVILGHLALLAANFLGDSLACCPEQRGSATDLVCGVRKGVQVGFPAFQLPGALSHWNVEIALFSSCSSRFPGKPTKCLLSTPLLQGEAECSQLPWILLHRSAVFMNNKVFPGASHTGCLSHV